MSQGGASTLRLMSDLKTVKQQPPEGVSASPLSEENIYVWGATVFGPDDTSWEGGIFNLTLEFTEDYPNKPPSVKFVTRMFHPNSECCAKGLSRTVCLTCALFAH